MPSPTNQTKLILLRASELGARLFRRNVGTGWIGNKTERVSVRTAVTMLPGDVLVRQARPLHTGEVGQYDTYGWRSVTITPDMVGTVIAQHVEIEAKQGEGRESGEQRAWGDAVRRAGGVAGVAREVADVDRILAGG